MAADAPFVDAVEQAAGQGQNAGFSALFSDGLARTLAIWMGFFMVMLTPYSAFSWLPSMPHRRGCRSPYYGSGLTAYNLGGVPDAPLGCRLGHVALWLAAAAGAGLRRRAAASALALKGVDFHRTPAC